MKTLLCSSLALLLVTVAAAAGQTGNRALLDAIRADDTVAIAARIAAGADVNVPDETGATPLMHSAVYASSPAAMRLLLDARANVNATNMAGATALMWAAHDTAKVRLLLERGAVVATKTSSGVTALVVAVRENNVDAVHLLLAAGADPVALTPAQVARALYERDPTGRMGQALTAAGARLPTAGDLGTLVRGGIGGLQDFRTFGRMVNDGVTPETEVKTAALSAPAFSLIAYDGSVPLVRTLLARRADPNLRASNGATPLMFAAFSSHTSPELIRALLENGADPGLRDANGRTALDWALTRGETPIAAVLRAAGAPASPLPSAPPPIARPRVAREAIALALTRLEPAGPGFFDRTKCISCHNQSLPLMAASRAAERGIAPGMVAERAIEATLGAWRTPRESLLLGAPAIGGFVANTTYGLASLADAHVPATPVTDAVAIRLAAEQRSDGSWMIDDVRPPLGDLTALPSTALAIRALTAYLPPGRRADLTGRIERARAFIRGVDPQSTQDEAFKLLGLTWTQAAGQEIATVRRRLLKLQRADGGWAQLPTLDSDAYATGQVLFALRAAGVTSAADAFKKGTAYLLRTQLEDGTWYVRSRALPFQTYFESGFPHGRDQFISAAATSWAAIALTESLR